MSSAFRGATSASPLPCEFDHGKGRSMRPAPNSGGATVEGHTGSPPAHSAGLGTVGEAIVLLDPVRDETGTVVDLIVRYANASASAAVGAEPEDIIGRGVLEFFPAARDRLFPKWVDVLHTGAPYHRDVGSGDGLIPGAYEVTGVRV